MASHDVLFHLEEGNTFRDKLLMSDIKNLLDDPGEDVEIKLVVNSSGVKLFLQASSPIKDQVESLLKLGVWVVIYWNSLEYFQLDETASIKALTFAVSGVGELVRKQSRGWSYIQP
ncbi:MAG: DsrE family protein [Candidatus Hodarchaeota archaeon]